MPVRISVIRLQNITRKMLRVIIQFRSLVYNNTLKYSVKIVFLLSSIVRAGYKRMFGFCPKHILTISTLFVAVTGCTTCSVFISRIHYQCVRLNPRRLCIFSKLCVITYDSSPLWNYQSLSLFLLFQKYVFG